MSEFLNPPSGDDSSTSSGEWSTDGSDAPPNQRRVSDAVHSYRASAASGTSTMPRGDMNGPPRGTLRLDKTVVRAGDVVGVYWDIPTLQTSAGDWIGIYEKGTLSLINYRLKTQ